jgi:hypothetical protein
MKNPMPPPVLLYVPDGLIKLKHMAPVLLFMGSAIPCAVADGCQRDSLTIQHIEGKRRGSGNKESYFVMLTTD